MSRHPRALSILSVIALVCSFISAASPTPALAQANDPCAGIAAGNCILVERSDDPYPVDPDNPTDQEVVDAGNQDIQCTAENGLDCTLRAAIMKANNRPGGDTDQVRIIFSINQNQEGYDEFTYQGQNIETWTVLVTQPLPALTRDRIEINGFSQEDSLSGSQNDFGPTIIIDGSDLTQPSRGLTVNSSRNIIRGLGITGFDVVSASAGIGIEIAPNAQNGNPASNNEIYGCYIGVDAVGITAQPNAYGIWVQSNNNIIGGQLSSNGTRNLVSGNLRDGIWITSSSGNKVRGTYIGVNRFGQLAIPNGSLSGGSGVALRSASGNVIGVEPTETFSAAYGNVISGNTTHGIDIFVGSNNQILGNLIGTNTNGTGALANGGDGILISSDSPATTGNQVGSGTSQYTRNVISGNTGAGVRLSGEPTDSNKVQGNYIGLRQNGFLALTTGLSPQTGVIIENGADSNQVGGTGTERNIISGNSGAGVRINGSPASNATAAGNQILGNIIGLSTPNLSPSQIVVGNGSHGVFLNGANGPINNTVITGNTISANGAGGAAGSGHGIYVLGNASDIQNTTVAGNMVGLLGTVAAPINPTPSTGASANDGDGIRFERPNGSVKKLNTITIGSADYAQRNIVSGNSGNGINITGSGIVTATILRNTVQNNTANGINVDNATNVTVDGGDAATPNLISGNTLTGIRFTGSTTMTVTYNRVQQNLQHGILVNGVGMRDILIGGNQVLTNTLSGIWGAGSSRNTTITANTVRGHNGSGVRWDGAAVNTTVSNNTVYTNTLNLSAVGLSGPQHGIWVGSGGGQQAVIAGNFVRGNANGAGIVLGPVDEAAISNNTEVLRNGLEGIRVDGPALHTLINGNTVDNNRQVGSALGGIVVSGTEGATIADNSVRNHNSVTTPAVLAGKPGIVLTNAESTLLRNNLVTKNQIGLSITGGLSTTVRLTSLTSSDQHGLLASATTQLTLTEQVKLNSNGGSGAHILGASSEVRILSSEVLSNTTNGIQLGAGSGPFPQQVTIQDNKISGNGIPVNPITGKPTISFPVAPAYLGLGIVFNPDGDAENSGDPNHDIDPPTNVAISSAGVVTGRVNTSGGPPSCLPADECKVQVFRANRFSQDGQGRDKLGEALVSATGLFTVSVGSIPAQLALTATDAGGSTSRFGLFTAAPGLAIGPARAAIAKPGDIITYTHRVTNTGNLEFTNLLLSAVSSRGWDQITITPAGQFGLKLGESKLITVSVRLPTGSDPRVVAGGVPDSLTVALTGRYRLEGDTADRTVRVEVVDVTTVAANVVLDLTPPSLSGRGLPGSTLPYAHTIRNNGNITSTFTLAANTNLGPSWVTQLSPTGSITLGPGQQRSVQILVTIPPQSTGVTSGTVALTNLSITTTSPVDASQNKVFTDTTTVTLVQAATLIADEVRDGAADEVTTIPHRITNLSNGTATFKLMYSSSLGSTVTFRSATTGVTLTGGDTFTLGTQPDSTPPNVLDILADVKVNRGALRGDKDSIIIYLVDSKGNIIGGAFVRDTINVTRSAVAPRIYTPVVWK